MLEFGVTLFLFGVTLFLFGVTLFLFELLFADLPFFAGVVAGELFLFEELLLPELLLLVLLLFAV